MASSLGTPLEIATQGFASPDGLGIATQGFIEPILGDIVMGGEAMVTYVQGYISIGGVVMGGAGVYTFSMCYIGEGGLVMGGTAGLKRSWCPVIAGGVTMGGTAGVSTTVVPVVGGDIITGGAAGFKRTWAYPTVGGITMGGAANVNIVINYPVGADGVTMGGAADVSRTWCPTVSGGVTMGGSGIISGPVFTKVQLGRGGVFTRGRPGIHFEPAPHQKEVTPMDYWKRIEKAIEDAKKREKKLYTYKGLCKVSTALRFHSRVVVLKRDMPDGDVIIHNPITISPKIKIEISRLFKNDLTQEEIHDLDDQFVLNDLLQRGDYELKTGDKSRYRYRAKTGAKASVTFTPATAKVVHFDAAKHRKRREEEEMVLGVYGRKRKNRREEELELLGLLD